MSYLKKAHDAVLRGAMCGTWIAGIFSGIVYFIESQEAAFGTDDQIKFLVRTTVSFMVAIVGALCHAHLLKEEDSE